MKHEVHITSKNIGVEDSCTEAIKPIRSGRSDKPGCPKVGEKHMVKVYTRTKDGADVVPLVRTWKLAGGSRKIYTSNELGTTESRIDRESATHLIPEIEDSKSNGNRSGRIPHIS